ncbi:MAG: ABC transporter ATP-binding protein [Planctomycetota bacterium]|nr:MAG: ABC transporter ATP-binding protein [Planctomycetota bacterium]
MPGERLTPLVEARALCRRFGRIEAVAGLDLRIPEGSLYGFLGPNGAGKTTVIRMLTGLLQPSSGEVLIAGRPYSEAGRGIRRMVGYVADTPPVYDYLTGRQHIAFVTSLYGVPPAVREAAAERLLEALGMSERADEICKGYSFGMKKKIHIAAVLACSPRVCFLDEPTSGLDPRSAWQLRELLREHCRRGNSVFLSTHLLETAEKVCDRIGILDRGRLRAEGTLDELRALGGEQSLEGIFLRLTAEGAQVATGNAGHPAR